MHVSNKQASLDHHNDLESCQLKDNTSTRAQSSQQGSQSVLPRESLMLDRYSVGDDKESFSRRGERVEPVNEEGPTDFCVGDVRKRLTQHSTAPRKMFQRDPNDPSGEREREKERERGRGEEEE